MSYMEMCNKKDRSPCRFFLSPDQIEKREIWFPFLLTAMGTR